MPINRSAAGFFLIYPIVSIIRSIYDNKKFIDIKRGYCIFGYKVTI